jgi:hypothetical protein
MSLACAQLSQAEEDLFPAELHWAAELRGVLYIGMIDI